MTRQLDISVSANPNVVTNVMMRTVCLTDRPDKEKWCGRPTGAEIQERSASAMCRFARRRNTCPIVGGSDCLASMKQATYVASATRKRSPHVLH